MYTLARDYISLLDNVTGHYVGTIKTNVWLPEMQTGLRFSRLLSPQVKWDGKFNILILKKKK